MFINFPFRASKLEIKPNITIKEILSISSIEITIRLSIFLVLV